MINRVLIRIKVVQMLYSYLLTQSNFNIEPAPESVSRDKKFAYTTYVNLLLMILKLAGAKVTYKERAIPGVGDNKYFSASRTIKILASDSQIKELAAKYADDVESLSTAISSIYDQTVKSSAYRSYIRQKNISISEDVEFWITIIKTIVEKNPEFVSILRNMPEFTNAGFEQGIAMALNTLKKLGDTRGMFIDAKNSLSKSLDKAYELYHSLLLLPIELTHLQEIRLDNARNKFLATHEDLNPSTRFVDNALVKILEQDKGLEAFVKENPISWNDNPILLKSLLDKILQSQIYADYMAATECGVKEDCDFWRAIYKQIILPSDEIAEALEAQSVYWNDDIDTIGTFVLKTFKRAASATPGTTVSLPKFKDEEDARFGSELFVTTVEHYDEYRGYIDSFVDTRQWDSERLAFMDVVIMCTAISELLNYPAIPIPVTMNEYIEIANCYSTPRSGQFINGVLFSIINHLKSEGKLLKN